MLVCILYYRDPEVGGTVDGAGYDDLQWSRILIRDGWMFTIYGPVPDEETEHLPISEPAPYVGRTSLPSDHKAILLRHDLPMEEDDFKSFLEYVYGTCVRQRFVQTVLESMDRLITEEEKEEAIRKIVADIDEADTVIYDYMPGAFADR